MEITKAFAFTHEGHPVLDLEIDGHAAYVEEPKLTLLAAGIVVLLDQDGYWATATAARYQPDPDAESIQIGGGCTVPELIKLVRRFEDGECGDLLAS